MNRRNLNRRRQGALERLQAASNPYDKTDKVEGKKHTKWEARVVQEIATLEARLKHATV